MTHRAAHDDRIVLLDESVARAFDVDRPVVLLPGGEGRTYRAGDVVLRRETTGAGANWIAELFAGIAETGFRIEQAEAGNTAEVAPTAQKALQELESDRLLTTTEAAEALGVRSINTVKLWRRNGFLASVQRGNGAMIPLAEVERVRAIRAADKLHDVSAAFGVPEGLSDEEMEQLSAARPGQLPWQQ